MIIFKLKLKKYSKKIIHYWVTLKYLKWSQIYWRIRFIIRRRFFTIFPNYYSSKYKKELSSISTLKSADFDLSFLYYKWSLQDPSIIKNRVNRILENRFTFLNREVSFKDTIEWRGDTFNKMSRLWKFYLHYHEFLVDLALAYNYKLLEEKEIYYQKYKEILLSWCKMNKLGEGDWPNAWHPYVISLRIVNWIISFELFKEAIEKDSSDFKRVILESLYTQALFLENNIELDILGNHLIKNGKALLFAGAFFADRRSKKWFNKGLQLLIDQSKEQILSDGGHFERSPMYHSIVFEDYLDSISVLKIYKYRNKMEDKIDIFKKKALDMANFLKDIIHSDGNIPLFNDSVFKNALLPEILFEYAKNTINFNLSNQKLNSEFLIKRESGYYIIRRGDFTIIIDGGNIGPDYLPGHGHCDLLSFELSIGKNRFIVDSGVYEYEEGYMRKFCRSTNAHNTVMVDKEEQSEIWGSFRVAKRAYPKEVELYAKGDKIFFKGSHTGYERLKGKVKHKRSICVTENIWCIIDSLQGSGEHLIESFIHFHPDIKDISIQSENILFLPEKEVSIFIWSPISKSVSVDIVEGYFCPEFGIKIKNLVIRLSSRRSLPFKFGYFIIPWNVRSGVTKQCEDILKVYLDNEEYEIPTFSCIL